MFNNGNNGGGNPNHDENGRFTSGSNKAAPKGNAAKPIGGARKKVLNMGFAPDENQRLLAYNALNEKLMKQYGNASDKIGTYKSLEPNWNERSWLVSNKYPDGWGDHEFGQQEDGTYYHRYVEPWKEGMDTDPRKRLKTDSGLSEDDVSNIMQDLYKDWEYETDPETGEKYVHDDTVDNMDHVFAYPDKNFDSLKGQEQDNHKIFDNIVNGMVDRFGRKYKNGNQYDWTNIYRDAARKAMNKRKIDTESDDYYKDDGWDY